MIDEEFLITVLSDAEQTKAMPGPLPKETKYKIVMRLAERWAMEAIQQKMEPHDYCEMKFKQLRPCQEWGEVTRIVLTAFVIREHLVFTDFLYDKKDNE